MKPGQKGKTQYANNNYDNTFMNKNQVENIKFVLHQKISNIQNILKEITILLEKDQLTTTQYNDIINMITKLKLKEKKNKGEKNERN